MFYFGLVSTNGPVDNCVENRPAASARSPVTAHSHADAKNGPKVKLLRINGLYQAIGAIAGTDPAGRGVFLLSATL